MTDLLQLHWRSHRQTQGLHPAARQASNPASKVIPFRETQASADGQNGFKAPFFASPLGPLEDDGLGEANTLILHEKTAFGPTKLMIHMGTSGQKCFETRPLFR